MLYSLRMIEDLAPGIDTEPKQKGIAFVFSFWTEKDNPNQLDRETKQRLDKAIKLYKSGKIAYFLVTGGEFTEGAKKPFGAMMADYLVSKNIPRNIILEERHSLDTPTNIRFGKFLLGQKKLEELPIYYVSSDVHLKRVKILVEGQGKTKPGDEYIAREGTVELKGMQRVKEVMNTLLNTYDPEGKFILSKNIRSKRHRPIPHPELRDLDRT